MSSSSAPSGVEALAAFEKIAQKLRRRLFKKSNAREALAQFQGLAQDLKRAGDTQHAAFCMIAVARCEQALGGSTLEAGALLDAGSSLLAEEADAHALGFDEFEDFVTEGMQCYLHAIQVLLSQDCGNLAASLCNELADALLGLDKPEEACQYYHRAADLAERDSPMAAVSFLDQAVACEIRLRDYDGACDTLVSIIQKLQRGRTGQLQGAVVQGGDDHSAFAQHQILTCRMTLLLLHLVQRLFNRAEGALAELTAAIAEAHGGVCNKTQADEALLDTFLSLIAACRADDIEAVEQIQLEIGPNLSRRAHDILQLIICELREPLSR